MVCHGPFATGNERGKLDVEGEVVHEPARRRFVDRSGGSESQLIYEAVGEGLVEFRSTWVDPSARGRGVGEGLVLAALAWAKDEGLKVIPACWFVRTVVGRYPEYQPLLER